MRNPGTPPVVVAPLGGDQSVSRILKLSTHRLSLDLSSGHDDADAVALIRYSFPPTTVMPTSSTALPNLPAVPPPTFVSTSYVSASVPFSPTLVFLLRLPTLNCLGAESALDAATLSSEPWSATDLRDPASEMNTASVDASSRGFLNDASTPTDLAEDTSVSLHQPDGHSMVYARPTVSRSERSVLKPVWEVSGSSYPRGVMTSAREVVRSTSNDAAPTPPASTVARRPARRSPSSSGPWADATTER
mmetsp:Transcript_1183/g.5261  ORF Transcript_1183/g.5261 Transcript_1183/m.5261 type:complete len:247 (+) Transcript_1183:1789-2529(+)